MKKLLYLFSALTAVTLSSNVSAVAFTALHAPKSLNRDLFEPSVDRKEKEAISDSQLTKKVTDEKVKEETPEKTNKKKQLSQAKAKKAAAEKTKKRREALEKVRKERLEQAKAQRKREEKIKAIQWKPLDSMEHLINNLDLSLKLDNLSLVNHSQVPKMDTLVKNAYNFIKDKKGTVLALDEPTIVGEETTTNIFSEEFQNDTPNVQTKYTQERTKEITEESSFTSTLNENISFSASASIPFIAEASLDMSFNAEQKWHDSKKTTLTYKAPQQPEVIDPQSKMKVIYILKQGLYETNGIIAYDVDLDDTIESSYYWTKSGEWGANHWKFRDVVKFLADCGFADQITYGSSDYSIIKTDDPYNPKRITLNLPVSWTATGSSILLNEKQSPLTPQNDEGYEGDIEDNDQTTNDQEQDVDTNNDKATDQDDQNIDEGYESDSEQNF